MYLWVIIATFIAALAALGTSLRSDIRSVTVSPQAQSVATKLYTQHHGLINYTFARMGTGADGKADFAPGVWNPAEHQGYVPYGFKSDSGIAQFTSEIFCLNNGGTGLPAGCQAAGGGAIPGKNCCAESGARVYVVTYGKIPLKWQDTRSGHPSEGLLRAMRDSSGYVNGMGYTVFREDYKDNKTVQEYSGGESMGILSQGQTSYIPIPKYITENDPFKSTCTNNHCLIYMSNI